MMQYDSVKNCEMSVQRIDISIFQSYSHASYIHCFIISTLQLLF